MLIGGRYIAPPYQLARVGACQFVNGELVSYESSWKTEALGDLGAEKQRRFVITTLDSQLQQLGALLEGNSIILMAESYGYPSWSVWWMRFYDLEPRDISADTFTWGQMLVSDKPLEDKKKITDKMLQVRATPFSTLPVCLKLTEDEMKRLQKSDTDAFIRQLRVVVDHAVRKRAQERRNEKDGEKNDAEEYDRMMRQEQEKWEREQRGGADPYKRPGFTYMGTDKDGQPIWLPDEPRLEDVRGIMLFAYSQIVDECRKDVTGKPYFPLDEWRAQVWGATVKGVPGRPWWLNTNSIAVGPSWYDTTWDKKEMFWRRKVGLDVLLDLEQA